MSGFEVLGVVLGVIPLLISAVDAYSLHLKGWRASAAELKSLHRQLSTEDAKLSNVCELLLSDMVPSQDVEPMLEHPFGPLWKSREFDTLVRRRLWKSYGPFVGAFGEVHEALESIGKRLQVQISPEGQAEWLGHGQVTRTFKTFLFRLRREEFQAELAVISRNIEDMETLVRQGVSLEPSRKKRTRGKVYEILRDMATSVHRALCSHLHCSHRHDVGLELAARRIEMDYEDDDAKVRRSAEFRMVLSLDLGREDTATRRLWDELSIRADEDLPEKGPTKKSTKKVTFHSQTSLLAKPVLSETQAALVLAARPVTDIAFIKTTPGQVEPLDLCLALRNACGAARRPQCYGYLVDQTRRGNQHFRVCPVSKGSDRWSVVTLEDVLQHKKGLRPLVLLAEKLQLALAIASSVLQLSKTPWLYQGLTPKDVYFFRCGDAPLSYQHAFLLTSLPEEEEDDDDDDGLKTFSRSSLSINPTIFSLGILLLEIFLGTSFEKLRNVYGEVAELGDDGDIPDDLFTAHKVLEKRVKRESREYAEVVNWCIQCIQSCGLDNSRFRQDVYDNVLMQLECLVDYSESRL